MTLAVRLGPKKARLEVLILISLAFALNFFWLGQGLTYAFALPMICLPLALRLVRTVLMTQASRQYNSLLAQAALLHMLFGMLLSIGFILK
jgi:1,4-dihydroxy-2-naphthoate octaprenyltransferase